MADAWEADERRALRLLSEPGAASASVLTYLELTRAVVAEAHEVLPDEHDAHTNPAGILGATRFKTYRGGRAYHTKCARLYCYSADPFLHMLERYALPDLGFLLGSDGTTNMSKKGECADSFLGWRSLIDRGF